MAISITDDRPYFVTLTDHLKNKVFYDTLTQPMIQGPDKRKMNKIEHIKKAGKKSRQNQFFVKLLVYDTYIIS